MRIRRAWIRVGCASLRGQKKKRERERERADKLQKEVQELKELLRKTLQTPGQAAVAPTPTPQEAQGGSGGGKDDMDDDEEDDEEDQDSEEARKRAASPGGWRQQKGKFPRTKSQEK